MKSSMIWLTATMLSAPAASAAETDPPAIEEILVTADFFDVTMMKSAGSVSVVDEQVIRDRGAKHLEALLDAVPNVNQSKGSSRTRFVQMRGVGDLEQFVDPKHFPSVGIVIDDIEMSGLASAGLLFDVDQVEFLRGPQGTRFGTSALAGSVHVRTQDPTDQLEGYVSGGYGNYDSWHAGGVLSGPITETLQGRIAVQQNESDGFIDNAYLGRDDTNGLEETLLRGKLRWLAGDRATVDLLGLYVDSSNGYDAFSLDNNRNTLADEPGHDNQETVGFAVRGDFDVSDTLTLQTVLTYTDSDLEYGFDEDWSYIGLCDGTSCNPGDEFSNTDNYIRDRDTGSIDLRLIRNEFSDAGLRYVIGVFAQRRDEDLHREYYGDFFSNYETDRYATYGQLELSLSEAWRFKAGLRYERFSDDYADSNDLALDTDDDLWSGELTVERFLANGSMLYATLSQGAKPGGVNTEASSSFPFMQPIFQDFVVDRLRFDSETLLNKEIGFKGVFFDDRVWLRAAAFHMDRDSAQLESWFWDDVGFLWIGFLDSTSDGENYGVELETAYSLTERIELFGALGLVETEVDELTVYDLDEGDFVVRSGRDQAKAPKYQFNLGANIRFTPSLSAHVEMEGRDDSYFGYYHDGKIGSYEVVNASLTYERGPLQVQAWGRNLFDEDYAVHGLYFGNDPRKGWINETYYQYGEPRVYGLNVRYSF